MLTRKDDVEIRCRNYYGKVRQIPYDIYLIIYLFRRAPTPRKETRRQDKGEELRKGKFVLSKML